MPNGSPGIKRWMAMGILVPLCVWLVYRNLIAPEEQRVAASLPQVESSGNTTASGRNPVDDRARPTPASGEETRRQPGQSLSQQDLAALDPTLREDLLERSREVEYQGSSRNIFQVYTPPPAPPPAAPAPSPTAAASAPPLPPPPPPAPTIPLKFYGVAAPSGSPQKKAFLTDGEEIFIAQEGEMIARFYKVVRIGINTIELEDSRSKQKQSLPLQEE